jgi:hypothetical protein
MAHLNPYLNFHRPCGYAPITVNERGKRRRINRPADYRTPYEKLQTLEQWEHFLKPGITTEALARQAAALTDIECAKRMQKARDGTHGSLPSRIKHRLGDNPVLGAKGRALNRRLKTESKSILSQCVFAYAAMASVHRCGRLLHPVRGSVQRRSSREAVTPSSPFPGPSHRNAPAPWSRLQHQHALCAKYREVIDGQESGVVPSGTLIAGKGIAYPPAPAQKNSKRRPSSADKQNVTSTESERRTSPRFLCASMVQVQVGSGPSASFHAGVIEDIAEGGMGVAMDGRVPTGSTVVISDGTRNISGVIRHCSARSGDEYHVGIEFTSGYRWVADNSWPEHRLDVVADAAIDPCPRFEAA